MDEVKKKNPKAKCELWAFDEHRIGLKPLIRKVWMPDGCYPETIVNHRFIWSYLYGFVCPENGETYWFIMPTTDVEIFNIVLENFAKDLGIGSEKQIILVIDNAGWHTSKDLIIPEGINFIFIPAYTPELQPAEKLWSLTNEYIANRNFDNIEQLEEAQSIGCSKISSQLEVVKSYTLFHWWPEIAC